jgi:hypothetical protein
VDDPWIELNPLASHVSTLEVFLAPVFNLECLQRVTIIRTNRLKLIRYNTAVFSSLSANAYDYFVVSEDFFSPSITYNTSKMYDYYWAPGVPGTMHEVYLNGSLKNTTSSNCMEAYGINFVSKSRNVLLVTTDADTNNDSLLYVGSWGSTDDVPYAWICGDSWSGTPYTNQPPSAVCTVATATAATSSWKVGSHHISYCMIQEVVEECQLSFSLLIMLVVIGVNASKTCIGKYTRLILRSICINFGLDLRSSPYSYGTIT